MLDSRKKAYNENKVVSIVGPGTTVTGEIKSEGTIRIEGNVAGRVESDDSIVVHETGRVKADLIAGQVIISGEVHGNVYAHDRLEITASGKVMGDITAPRVSIAEGVMFEGKCQMKPPGQIKPPLPAGLQTAPPAAAPQQQQVPQQQPLPAQPRPQA
ncbi:MAG TPA: polymer-forming cytoskeletal protein [Candidatus Hydrogenedentes bacterium]|nr:polymer-forming cytoskeletal protein [Candidatus Hydrogenedentota bacterium]